MKIETFTQYVTSSGVISPMTVGHNRSLAHFLGAWYYLFEVREWFEFHFDVQDPKQSLPVVGDWKRDIVPLLPTPTLPAEAYIALLKEDLVEACIRF